MKQITCVIQARLHSERVPRKMVRPFGDSCLLEIALKKLLACKHLSPDRIVLGAYDEEIRAVGRKLGVRIYERTLESTYEPVAPEVIWKYAWDIESEYFLNINACNPLLRTETIDKALELFQNSDYNSLFSVVKRKNFFFDKDSRLVSKFNGEDKYLRTLESKLVEPLYEAAHSIYIWNAKFLRENLAMWTFGPKDPYLFEMPPEECFDIDYPWQLELAEAMVSRRGAGTELAGAK